MKTLGVVVIIATGHQTSGRRCFLHAALSCARQQNAAGKYRSASRISLARSFVRSAAAGQTAAPHMV